MSERFQRVENPLSSIITTKTIRQQPTLCRQLQKTKNIPAKFCPGSNVTLVGLDFQRTLSSLRHSLWPSCVVKIGKNCPSKMCSIYLRKNNIIFYKVNFKTNQILLKVLKLKSVQYRAVICMSERFQRVENPLSSIITTKTIRQQPTLCRQLQKTKNIPAKLCPGSNVIFVSLDIQRTLSSLGHSLWPSCVVKNGKKIVLRKCVASIQGKTTLFFTKSTLRQTKSFEEC